MKVTLRCPVPDPTSWLGHDDRAVFSKVEEYEVEGELLEEIKRLRQEVVELQRAVSSLNRITQPFMER